MTTTPKTAHTKAEIAEAIELFRRMQLIRRFEDKVQSLFQQGHVHGTTHLYSGQEAVAVGVGSVIQPGDRVAATYRGHGHALGIGVEPQGLMDELLGRATGVCGGRAGSMNVVDLAHGLMGSFGIVGGSIAAATGAALALRGKGSVAVAYFGDGATNQGYFHECLNFAAVMKLPMVFVCENNLYGEFTPWETVTAGQIGARPKAMDVPYVSVDGNDVWAVQGVARDAVAAARSGAGPVFIEALTYRFVGHSRSDPGAYRKKGELEAWKLRDPLIIGADRLRSEYGVGDDAIEAVRVSVDEELETVASAALAAPWPDPSLVVAEFSGGIRG